MKKYKLTEETKIIDGKELYRIEALKDFGSVKKGEKGGWIEKESNLSQNGDCWVYGNAMAYDDAKVFGNAMVSGSAMVSGNARVYGNAWICGYARVFDDAMVSGNAMVYGNAWVSNSARVFDNASVYGNAMVFGRAKVSNNTWISGDAEIYYNANIYEGNIEPTITNEIEEIEEIVNEIKQILLKNDNDPTKIISDEMIDEIAYDLRDIKEGLKGISGALRGLDY